jgi:DNA-binding CsgD family transcriptional regulator
MKTASVDKGGIAALSTREEQVLSYAAAGYLDKQISNTLGVSLNTLRTYWQRIRTKLGDAPRTALAVAYVEQVAAQSQAAEIADPRHDWEIDLDRDVIRRVSNREVRLDVPIGSELPMEEVFSMFHPEDLPKLRALLTSVKRGDLTAFNYVARVFTPTGIENTSAFIQVERDQNGRPVRVLGRRADMVDLRAPTIGRVEIGYWQRDLQTNEFTADDGFHHIFRLDRGPKLRERAMKRFHPEEVAKCRTFVSDTVAERKTRARETHRLVFEDGSILWVTTDLRIEYEGEKAMRALGAVMSFK